MNVKKKEKKFWKYVKNKGLYLFQFKNGQPKGMEFITIPKLSAFGTISIEREVSSKNGIKSGYWVYFIN